MPLFEYKCEVCGIRFERLQRKGDPNPKLCPQCGGPVRRLIQPPRIIFKGSGFYVTDNRRSSAGSRRSSASETSESSSDKPESKKTNENSD
jgi:putative FmdB family regulatory protein